MLGSKSTKLIDANEPSVAFGQSPGPVAVQRRPGKISLGLKNAETSHHSWEGRSLVRGEWREGHSRSVGGGRKHKARMDSTCRGPWGADRMLGLGERAAWPLTTQACSHRDVSSGPGSAASSCVTSGKPLHAREPVSASL